MDFEKLLIELGIEAPKAKEIAGKINLELPKSFMPKDKYNEVNDQVKDLKTQLSERDKQLKDLGEKAKGNEELQKQINDLQELNKNTTKDFEGKISKMKFDYSLEGALKAANVKNTKAVKALLNLDNVKIDGENFIGLSDQIEALKKSDAYLFEQTVGGKTPSNNGGGAPGATEMDEVAKTFSNSLGL